jgi:hypothetical protein
MSYVKVSDPSIIDLSAWQQVISVVNEHSDSISALTNNFGTSTSSDWSKSDVAHLYDPANQIIMTGRASVATATASNNGNGLYYGTVNLDAASFASVPIVTATVNMGTPGNGGAVATANPDIVVIVYSVNTTSFSWRLMRANGSTVATKTLSGNFYINWTAIGPK